MTHHGAAHLDAVDALTMLSRSPPREGAPGADEKTLTIPAVDENGIPLRTSWSARPGSGSRHSVSVAAAPVDVGCVPSPAAPVMESATANTMALAAFPPHGMDARPDSENYHAANVTYPPQHTPDPSRSTSVNVHEQHCGRQQATQPQTANTPPPSVHHVPQPPPGYSSLQQTGGAAPPFDRTFPGTPPGNIAPPHQPAAMVMAPQQPPQPQPMPPYPRPAGPAPQLSHYHNPMSSSTVWRVVDGQPMESQQPMQQVAPPQQHVLLGSPKHMAPGAHPALPQPQHHLHAAMAPPPQLLAPHQPNLGHPFVPRQQYQVMDQGAQQPIKISPHMQMAFVPGAATFTQVGGDAIACGPSAAAMAPSLMQAVPVGGTVHGQYHGPPSIVLPSSAACATRISTSGQRGRRRGTCKSDKGLCDKCGSRKRGFGNGYCINKECRRRNNVSMWPAQTARSMVEHTTC